MLTSTTKDKRVPSVTHKARSQSVSLTVPVRKSHRARIRAILENPCRHVEPTTDRSVRNYSEQSAQTALGLSQSPSPRVSSVEGARSAASTLTKSGSRHIRAVAGGFQRGSEGRSRFQSTKNDSERHQRAVETQENEQQWMQASTLADTYPVRSPVEIPSAALGIGQVSHGSRSNAGLPSHDLSQSNHRIHSAVSQNSATRIPMRAGVAGLKSQLQRDVPQAGSRAARQSLRQTRRELRRLGLGRRARNILLTLHSSTGNRVTYSHANLLGIGRGIVNLGGSHTLTQRFVNVANAVTGGILSAADLVVLMDLRSAYSDNQLGVLGTGLVAGLANVGGTRGARDLVQFALISTPAAADIVTFMQNPHPVTGRHIPDDNFAGHSTTHLGVGERGDLGSTIQPPAITPADIGNLRWRKTGTGVLDMLNPAFGSARYTAPETASSVRLELVGVTVPYAGTVFETLNRTIIPPQNWGRVEQYPGTGIRHTQGLVGVGFQGRFRVKASQPVSFDRLENQEDSNGGVTGVGTNCVIAKNGEVHVPNTTWVSVNAGNAGATNGVTMGNIDTISTPHFAHTAAWFVPANGNGQFTWNIQWFYRVLGSSSHYQYTTVNHQEDYTIDTTAAANHTAAIQKGGSATFSRARMDPSSTY